MLLKIASYQNPEILLLGVSEMASARIFLISRERKQMKCSHPLAVASAFMEINDKFPKRLISMIVLKGKDLFNSFYT